MKKSQELKERTLRAREKFDGDMTPELEKWFDSAFARIVLIEAMEDLEELGLIKRKAVK